MDKTNNSNDPARDEVEYLYQDLIRDPDEDPDSNLARDENDDDDEDEGNYGYVKRDEVESTEFQTPLSLSQLLDDIDRLRITVESWGLVIARMMHERGTSSQVMTLNMLNLYATAFEDGNISLSMIAHEDGSLEFLMTDGDKEPLDGDSSLPLGDVPN